MANKWGKQWKQWQTLFWGLQNHWDGDRSHEIKRELLIGRKAMINLDSIFKSKDITSSTKDHLVRSMVFPVVVYGCESWTIKKAGHWRLDAFKLWCWTLKSPFYCKEIQQINPKGNQSWIFIGKTDAETEAPVLWPPDVKNWLLGKGPDAGKDWKQGEKGTTENEMVKDITESMDMGLGGLRVLVMDREAWHAMVHGVTKSQKWLSYWTELNSGYS